MHAVNKEIIFRRVAHPFMLSPLSNLRLLPAGMVPEKDGSF